LCSPGGSTILAGCLRNMVASISSCFFPAGDECRYSPTAPRLICQVKHSLKLTYTLHICRKLRAVPFLRGSAQVPPTGRLLHPIRNCGVPRAAGAQSARRHINLVYTRRSLAQQCTRTRLLQVQVDSKRAHAIRTLWSVSSIPAYRHVG